MFNFHSRESHSSGPEIISGKTGHDLPVLHLAPEIDPEVFSAFTGPEGGITSIARIGENGFGSPNDDGAAPRIPRSAAEDSEDFDYIDLDEIGGGSRGGSRRQSADNVIDGKGNQRLNVRKIRSSSYE